MKHKTWFRLVIKAIGILIIALSIGDAIAFWWSLLIESRNIGMLPQWDSYGFGYGLGQVTTLAIGLYLLLGGEWVVNCCIPSNRDYCPNCGYDVSKSPAAPRCSECGAALPKEAPQ